MGVWRSLAGVVDIALTSAAPAQMLTVMNDKGIQFLGTKYIDEMNVQVTVYRKDYPLLCEIADKRGETYRITKYRGLYWVLKDLLHRPVLTIGIAGVLFLAMFLPSRVLFICVEGNVTIPSRLIIEKAEVCGISFGASRKLVRSEQMKNSLLDAVPQLQWAGINTYGCVAVISVEERQETSQEPTHGDCVGSVVAACDGIIQEMTVYRGNPVCRVGQAVAEGQLLVSGYTDCGILIKAERAEAEIIAQTQRSLEAATLLPLEKRAHLEHSDRNFSLIIGKKLVNLYKGSGISDTGCVKIRTQSYVTLPGGFQLPIVLVEERFDYYDNAKLEEPDVNDHAWMHSFAEEYLQEQMIAGSILNSNVSLDIDDGVVCLYGEYDCREMIGRLQSEEIIKGNGTSD